ncbi:hypothetical protein PT285_09805 [Lactobacillus sp. ESL0791]|uniref:BglG family transcription antiterminator n=1 Tax=Lactobacillus sp. ESL0791 TaxID=2983234 RepID=UPI0023FA0C33|nr:hypothetical protein [Lactobacillus sp. ESL0791]MDF7639694.1 hypothetical protein [Lactobacillus sp. ESL0791]
MNTRIYKFISLLLERPDMNIHSLSHELGLSKQQTNYTLTLINERLRKLNLQPITKTNSGYLIFSKSIGKLLQENDFSEADYSTEEREQIILIYLMINSNYVSLRHLVHALQYSKGTIVNDIKLLTDKVQEFNLTIHYNRRSGYYVAGSEDEMFRAVTKMLFADSMNLNCIRPINVFFSKKVKQMSLYLFRKIEAEIKVTFADKTFVPLITALQVILTRGLINQNNNEQVEEFIHATAEYQKLRGDQMLNEFDNQHVKWLALEFLSTAIFNKKTVFAQQQADPLKKYIQQIAADFEKAESLTVKKHAKFLNRLYNYLRPAAYCAKYDLRPKAKASQQVSKSTNRLLHPLESYLGTRFPAGAAVGLEHYLDGIIAATNKKKQCVYHGILVCDENELICAVLNEKLRKMFPMIKFSEPRSIRDFVQLSRSYEIIFSTAPLRTNTLNIVVKPTMTQAEWIVVEYWVLRKLGITKLTNQIESLIKLFEQETASLDNHHLQEKIAQILLCDSVDD